MRKRLLIPLLSAALAALAAPASAQAPAAPPAEAPAAPPAEAPPPAAEAPASAAARLAAAERRYGDIDFAGAAEGAEAAIEAGGLSREQVLRAYGLLATSRAALDDAAGARAAFVTLLGADPGFVADANLGPRVTSAFEEAKAFWAAQHGRPSLSASASLRPGGSGSLRISVKNPLGFFAKVRAGHRFRGAGAFETREIPAGETSIPLEAPRRAATLEYYVVGLDARGNVLSTNGTEASPHTLFVEAPQPPEPARRPERPAPKGGSIFGSPWFWGAVGVVVLGGAAAGFAAASQTSPPTSALATPQLLCGPSRCR